MAEWKARLARLMNGLGGGEEPDPMRPWEAEDQRLAKTGSSRRIAEQLLRATMAQQPYGVAGGIARGLDAFTARRADRRAMEAESEVRSARDGRIAEAFRTAGAPGEDGQPVGYRQRLDALAQNPDPAVRRIALSMQPDLMRAGAEGEQKTDLEEALGRVRNRTSVEGARQMIPVQVEQETALGPVRANNAGLQTTATETAREPFAVRSDQRQYDSAIGQIRERGSQERLTDQVDPDNARGPGGGLNTTQANIAGKLGTDFEQMTSSARAIAHDPKVQYVLSDEGRAAVQRLDPTAVGSLRYALARFSNGAGALATADVTMSDGSTLQSRGQALLNSLNDKGEMNARQVRQALELLEVANNNAASQISAAGTRQTEAARRMGVEERYLGLVTPGWTAPAPTPAPDVTADQASQAAQRPWSWRSMAQAATGGGGGSAPPRPPGVPADAVWDGSGWVRRR
jgi:hypothetical protein